MRQQAESSFDCVARAYMLLLVGCTIFVDKTFALVEAKYCHYLGTCLDVVDIVGGQLYLGDASIYTCKQLDGYAYLNMTSLKIFKN